MQMGSSTVPGPRIGKMSETVTISAVISGYWMAEQIEDDEGFAEGDRVNQKIRESKAGGGPRKAADRFSQLLCPPGTDPVGGKPRDAGAVPQKQTGRDRDQREHQKQRRNRED